MPGHIEHSYVGGLSGLVFAIFRVEGKPNEQRVLEAIGGFIVGSVAGCIPDIIEPAKKLGPCHRKSAHSVVLGAGIVGATTVFLAQSQEWFRARAAECATRRNGYEKGTILHMVFDLLEKLCYILAGGVPGLAAGYLSHLVLDAGTVKGLPWWC